MMSGEHRLTVAAHLRRETYRSIERLQPIPLPYTWQTTTVTYTTTPRRGVRCSRMLGDTTSELPVTPSTEPPIDRQEGD